MKRKKLLTMAALAGAFFIGAALIGKAAEVDTAWYAAQNPDVVAALGDSPEMMRLHYETFGRKESRAANEHDMEAKLRKLFAPDEYVAMYPDIGMKNGNDREELFRHYIAYGLLETRRPSRKVSPEAAAVLQQKISNILRGAGVEILPACVQLVEIITDTISEDLGGAKAQADLRQAAPLVEAAITEFYEEVTNLPPAQGSPEEDRIAGSVCGAPAKAAVWAPLVDYSELREALNPRLHQVNIETTVETNAHSTYQDIMVLTFQAPQIAAIPRHTNANRDKAYFFGVGVPYIGAGYTYNWGFTSGKEGSRELEEAAAIAAVNADFSQDKGKTAEVNGIAIFHWGLNTERTETSRWGYLAVKDWNNTVVAKYILDFSKLSFDQNT